MALDEPAEVDRHMKVEAKLLLGLGLFFGIMCAVYWNWSLENAGGVMMFAGMLLAPPAATTTGGAGA